MCHLDPKVDETTKDGQRHQDWEALKWELNSCVFPVYTSSLVNSEFETPGLLFFLSSFTSEQKSLWKTFLRHERDRT